jgi:Uma2 family endonuclease
VETKALVSVEEYLTTSYEPDCDYVDGELVERNVGEFDHSELQFQITTYLRRRYLKLGFIAVIEQRVQVGPTRFRIPDVCVARFEKPMPQIFHTPPLIVIEILSPEDRVGKMRKRLDDYLNFSVPNVWVIDPEERRAFIQRQGGSTESTDLILRAEGCEIVLPLPEVFAALQ